VSTGREFFLRPLYFRRKGRNETWGGKIFFPQPSDTQRLNLANTASVVGRKWELQRLGFDRPPGQLGLSMASHLRPKRRAAKSPAQRKAPKPSFVSQPGVWGEMELDGPWAHPVLTVRLNPDTRIPVPPQNASPAPNRASPWKPPQNRVPPALFPWKANYEVEQFNAGPPGPDFLKPGPMGFFFPNRARRMVQMAKFANLGANGQPGRTRSHISSESGDPPPPDPRTEKPAHGPLPPGSFGPAPRKFGFFHSPFLVF